MVAGGIKSNSNRLYRDRLPFLSQQVDDELANQLICILLLLDADSSKQHIHLYINTLGGAILAGLAIYDAMQSLAAEIHTICMGIAASIGSVVLIAGDSTKRMALTHANALINFIHPPMLIIVDYWQNQE